MVRSARAPFYAVPYSIIDVCRILLQSQREMALVPYHFLKVAV